MLHAFSAFWRDFSVFPAVTAVAAVTAFTAVTAVAVAAVTAVAVAVAAVTVTAVTVTAVTAVAVTVTAVAFVCEVRVHFFYMMCSTVKILTWPSINHIAFAFSMITALPGLDLFLGRDTDMDADIHGGSKVWCYLCMHTVV